MFTLVFQGTSTCDGTQDDHLPTTENNGMDSRFCTFRDSLGTVYFMLLGQIGPDETDGSTIGKVIYAIFMFIVVILLTNVLIAIVTDSYNHIKSSKAQQVFWYNKFAFITEVEIYFGFFPRFKCDKKLEEQSETWRRKTWNDWVDFKNADGDYFYDDEGICGNLRYWSILFVSYLLVLLWLIAGLISLGSFWPPQVREFIFCYNVKEVTSTRATKHNTIYSNERITEQINSLREETKINRNSLKKEINCLREDVKEIKNLLRELIKD
mmetsp:Transcript_12363/g.16530  ORF Transcript_12363/g.16530 Transcript_12363/m.16530 type:complete len:267 (+) Transcript_12363:1498-2298(+)